MKKTLISFISMLTISTYISAMDDFYVGGGLALQDADGLDVGSALVVKGGALLKNIDIKVGTLGVEGEITQTVIGMSPNIGGDVRYTILGGYATYVYDLNSDFFAKARAGVVYYNPNRSYKDDGIEPSVSAGGGYNFNRDLSFYAEVTRVDELTNLSVGATYKLSGLK